MKTFQFLAIILNFSLISCVDRIQNPSIIPNDTAAILEIAVREGTSVRYMPDASSLHNSDSFGDSILFTSAVLPLTILPLVGDSQTFKILPESQICNILRQDSVLANARNYLNITAFEKNDSGYRVQIQNLSCQKFGGGGSVTLYFKKDGDSIALKERHSYSLN